ncbi:MAG: hypothetical protein IJ491_09340 [Clostridia bacterium]|nr:hypothetical protein [Clostridia bacterium]
MICRKCANMFDDSLSSCPECGTSAIMQENEAEKKPFTLNIPDEEIEKPAIITAEAENEKEPDGEENGEAVKENEEQYTAPEYELSLEEKPLPKVKKIQRKSAADKNKAEKKSNKESVGDKSAAALIVSVVCILACMMLVLTFVSVKSDVFKGNSQAVKTVALSGLSGEEKGELEKWLSGVSAVCDSDLDASHTTVNELLDMVKPYDANGLYRALYDHTQITANIPDPAQRYANENGDYSYYKIEEEKIDAIVELFGLNVNHTANTDDCYYYGGYYYFRDKLDYEPEISYIADVKESKRIQDGSYYIECSFLQESNLSAETKERYAIVEKVSSEDDSETQWKITRLSDEPIFNSSGVLIENESGISFEMKTEIIEKKASDGTVYHKYIIEYPVFTGGSLGEQTANQLYSDMITAFSMEEDSVQSDYKKFLKNGGNKDELPLLTHVVSRVTYTDNGYISVLEDTAEYVPSSMPVDENEAQNENGEQEETTQAENEETQPVKLPERTVEGYNFDVESGDFITKDAIIGKDYLVISELLYRIYGGYDYSDIAVKLQQGVETDTSEDDYENNEAEEIPEDEDGLGMKIYESASVICDGGYMFCFVSQDGCAHDVIIPFDIPGLFAVELQ